MASAKLRVLTLNGGSSSIKFAVFESGEFPQPMLSGAFERVAQPEATLKIKGPHAEHQASHAVNAPNMRKLLMCWWTGSRSILVVI